MICRRRRKDLPPRYWLAPFILEMMTRRSKYSIPTSTPSNYYTSLKLKSKKHFYGPPRGLIGVLAYI